MWHVEMVMLNRIVVKHIANRLRRIQVNLLNFAIMKSAINRIVVTINLNSSPTHLVDQIALLLEVTAFENEVLGVTVLPAW